MSAPAAPAAPARGEADTAAGCGAMVGAGEMTGGGTSVVAEARSGNGAAAACSGASGTDGAVANDCPFSSAICRRSSATSCSSRATRSVTGSTPGWVPASGGASASGCAHRELARWSRYRMTAARPTPISAPRKAPMTPPAAAPTIKPMIPNIQRIVLVVLLVGQVACLPLHPGFPTPARNACTACIYRNRRGMGMHQSTEACDACHRPVRQCALR